MHGSQSCYGELVELTVDDIWQIADAGDQEFWRLGLVHSSHRGASELCAEDNGGLSQQACTELAEEIQASAGRHADRPRSYFRMTRRAAAF